METRHIRVRSKLGEQVHMNGLKKRLLSLREKNEQGFSLIDVVVTVAIIVALSVGGFVAYNGLINSAKQGAVDYAASNVYKAALVYESDTNSDTDACSAVDEYNNSSKEIRVQLMVPKSGLGTATPTDPGQFDYYPAESGQDAYTKCA